MNGGPEPLLEGPTSLRLSMVQEIYDLAMEAAGDVWPTPALALGYLFERGADFLSGDSALPAIVGDASSDLLSALHSYREDLLLVQALYLLSRDVTFALTEQSAAAEATWVRLADRHIEIRAQIVERRREEEKLKRQLVALGGSAVPLPEHGELPVTWGDRPRKGRGMFDHLFDGVTRDEYEVRVEPSVLAAADAAAAKRGWHDEWGDDARLLVLTHGLSLVLREHEADDIDQDDDDSVREGHDAARSRLMAIEGRYSTLRRRLFELRHNNRILGWRITALEVEAAGMLQRLDQFLMDRDRLETEISLRHTAGASVAEPADQAAPPGWRDRWGRLFGRSD
jgi:hypothetical protein